MKTFILAQYFTVAMVLTITIGLFTLKPTVEQAAVTTALVTDVVNNDQEMFLNEQYK